MTIAERIRQVESAIARACADCGRDPATVDLLPVSKRHPPEAIRGAMAAGVSCFGENRVQELATKAQLLAETDVRWHLIGSLQTNKVEQLLDVRHLALVHSLDRRKLADALQRSQESRGGDLAVLLQIDATGEAAKHGVAPGDALALLEHVIADCPALRSVGVMAMGPLVGDPGPVFQAVARLHEDLRQATGLPLPTRSMGMTGDMAVAIVHGSTLVRVGTGVFGPRPA